MDRRTLLLSSVSLLAVAASLPAEAAGPAGPPNPDDTNRIRRLEIGSMAEGMAAGQHLFDEPIIHVVVGSDDWQPSPDELVQICDLFAKANDESSEAPFGTVIVTVPGVKAFDIQHTDSATLRSSVMELEMLLAAYRSELTRRSF